jgi:hypothetical protein
MITMHDDDIIGIADVILRPLETLMEVLMVKDLINQTYVEWFSSDFNRVVQEIVPSEVARNAIIAKMNDLHVRLWQYYDDHLVNTGRPSCFSGKVQVTRSEE